MCFVTLVCNKLVENVVLIIDIITGKSKSSQNGGCPCTNFDMFFVVSFNSLTLEGVYLVSIEHLADV